ncbi:ABC transporter ATP-binding protein/permease [Candidatus Saccharibacteria bacterium]|nr:ABC transporter ATP-binding protein/permease [Candidatus Saccharibacteria bacterium]
MKRNTGDTSQAWRLVWGTYGRYKAWWGAMSLSISFRIAKIVLMPLFSSLMLGRMAMGDFRGALYFALAYAAMSFVHGVAAPLGYYYATKVEHIGYRIIMNKHFDKLVQADVEYFANNKTGQLAARARSLGDSVLDLLRFIRRRFSETVIAIVLPTIIIFTQSWLIGLVVAALGISLIFYAKWSAKYLQPTRQKARDTYHENTGIISDIMMNIIAIRAAARERDLSRRMEKRWDLEIKHFLRKHFLTIRLGLGKELVGFLFFSSAALLVVWQGYTSAISLTAAILIMQYLMTILVGCYSLNDDIEDISDCIDKIQPAAEFMERQNKIVDKPGAKTLKKIRGNIELSHVTMGYEGNKVFRNLSLQIPAGQKVGIVGVSGAGKTTLVKLIMRFDDVESGKVMIDSLDVRNVKQDSLRRNMAYVPQGPLLMHDTIDANIRLGNPKATREQVLKAVRAAHLTDLIKTLPHGLDTIVGERGIKLSGGQKQRVAIARAMLQGAPVMILDEATSALDSESEAIIKDSFKSIFRNKTAVVVAHRLSTLRDMDRIIVLAGGRIVEDGTHLSLVRREGVYAKMWKRQSQFED